ncbi:hypothetical protein ACFY5D_20960 [Paeniglutamicibacter sp. NPDC012692]|uniref:hypothetical protein n=1 Tax=Paeniglutamicibacter sp. NPDC012692 TaxID=3364388 RepID=UPI0036CF77D2
MTRAIMGSGMQAAEQAQRRVSMSQAEASAQVARERGVAEMIRRELSSPSFWKHASSEAIADRMTVASELALKHNDASQAFMAGADRIRNQYGINVEDINRDHPTSSVQRHQALRDALDDYLASQRLNSEAQGKEAGTEVAETGAIAEDGKDTAHELEQAAAAAKQDEQANLARAGEAEAETQQDAKHTQADEAKETTRPSDDPTDRPDNEPSAAPAAVLAVWKEKGGKDADFPKAPTTHNSQAAMKNRKKVLDAVGTQRGQSQELSR